MLFAAISAPVLLIESIVVAPYLTINLPPDSWIVKLVVVRLVTLPPSVMFPELVTVPDSVKPLAEPVPVTEVTVPVPGVAGEAQTGTPPVTVNTWLVDPIFSLASVVVVLA